MDVVTFLANIGSALAMGIVIGFREVVISGTHRGEFAGLKPLGNPIRIELAAFYIFDEPSGKLLAERIYYDQARLAQQMQSRQEAAAVS